ncbi:GntR family transcriptional regulator [Sulfitobacter albidus]|uniref:GntR family transcriptional regulator n=1 Tax=Sulfitobacter albidus TaxID=2829501 RepID=A0A975JD43_9RHOB|nr:GntR family transcriptional regulator [Sulfitobacter albidus]QUJ76045.1 GntR family transcriptional regulator [Sulfitobacter albidus]
MTDKAPSNTARAIARLRELIFAGELAAGTDHLESELADLLEMSRTPVREAVLTLEAQGLLTMRPRKGVRILPLSPEDMAEIYDVLTELESHAAERAARARHNSRDLATLTRAVDDMEAAIRGNDLEGWARADETFHDELVRLGGNSRIVAITQMMADQVRRARATTLHLRPLPSKSTEDHRTVLDAIRDGRGGAARDAHRQHRQRSKAILVALLHDHRLRYL